MAEPRPLAVKICCIADTAEADLALAANVTALGLVGPMPSGPGTRSDSEIREVTNYLAAHNAPAFAVLLSAETEAAEIAAHVARCQPTALQLVQHVAPAEYPELRRLLGDLPILQVVHVENESALTLAATYAQLADALLLDSGAPQAAVAELGGTGRVHDWSISREIVVRSQIPVFLAGGLAPHNVAAAIAAVEPYGVDLCSGVRTDGALDAAKLTAYMTEIAAAGYAPRPRSSSKLLR